MSGVFDLFGTNKKRYGTGFWPMYNKRPWDFSPPPGIAAITDPVAVAAEAAKEFRKAGWPGLALIDLDFQIAILDKPEAEVAKEIEAWFDAHRTKVADLIESRLPNYKSVEISKTCEIAMREAITAYRAGLYLTVVRLLFPEFESIGRNLLTDPAQKTSQSQVIKQLKEALMESHVIKDDPLESFTLFHFIEEHFFEKCFTAADATAFGAIPNRHAEMHGFESYGTLQGASAVLISFDYLLKMMRRQIDFGQITLKA